MLSPAIDSQVARQKGNGQCGKLAQTAHLDRLASLGELAAGLAHELAQPLLAAQNYSSAAIATCKKQAEADPALLDSLEGIHAQVSRAAQIARRIQNFIAKRSPECVTFDIGTAVREAAALVGHQFADRELKLTLKLKSDLPRAYADNVLIQQVIVNLLRNAMEESTNTSREVEVETSLHPGGFVRVTVSDHGRGIPESDLETLFIPFCSTKSNGLGVGLSLSRTLIEANDGQIWAENRPTGGAMFSFILPVASGARS